MQYCSYPCDKCGGHDRVSNSWKYRWYCNECFNEAHRHAMKELNCISERTYCDSALYKFAKEQYMKEFDTVLTCTALQSKDDDFVKNVTEAVWQSVGPSFHASQCKCDDDTAQRAQDLFRARVDYAIRECLNNLRD